MTKASRDTQTRRRERKGNEGEREREREGEKRGRGQVFPATNQRPGTHQGERGGPEYYIQEHHQKKERQGKEGVPSYDTSVQGHTKRKEGFPAMTKASRDTQTRRRERKEGEKREREKRGRGQVFPATNKRPGTHQGERGEPEYYIQEHPNKRRGKRGGGEEGRLSSRQVGPLRPRTPCQNGWLLRPLRSRTGMSQLGIQ